MSLTTVFDNTAAKEDFGFRYTIPFSEGASRTIQWLKEHRKIEDCSKDPIYDWVIELWDEMTSQMVAKLKKRLNQIGVTQLDVGRMKSA
ncbi:MAG: hypothetical protein NZ805_02200 [Armatimonadetes bacterium]|nr:hypothetical protein [Armatimonadota bacterium]MDW8026817.1 hypothetical protein [Armatimonadota bacterium]